jgi:hypothetical protein
MLNPSKISFSLCKFKALKADFLLWITNVYVFYNMGKHVLNIIWRSHKNEFKKWKVMIILYVYFVQNETTTTNEEKWVKICLKNINIIF